MPWARPLNTQTRGSGFYPQHARLKSSFSGLKYISDRLRSLPGYFARIAVAMRELSVGKQYCMFEYVDVVRLMMFVYCHYINHNVVLIKLISLTVLARY